MGSVSSKAVNTPAQGIVRNNSQRSGNNAKTNPSPLSRKKPTLKQQQSSSSSIILPTGTAPQSSKNYEPMPIDDLTAHKDPSKAFSQAMDSINQEFWGTKCDGMNNLRRVIKFHPHLVVSQLHRTVMCVLTEIKNLRSQVSRQAIGVLTEMFSSLKRNMDPELDQATKLLLNKCMETSAFIRDDVELSLTTMVECTSLQRALQALIASGTEQRSVVVRKTRARFVNKVVYSMGPGRVLSGIKDITDKLLPAVAEYLQDSSLETRYYAQRIIHLLMSHEDFDKLMTKHVPSQSLRNIQDKLDNIRKKGVGEPPSEISSARSRRSGQGTRSGQGSRSSSSSRQNSACSSNTIGVKRRSGVSRGGEAAIQEVKVVTDLLAATDWRDRQRGLQSLEILTTQHPTIVGAHIIKVCDKLIPCLRDSNSKVNVQALQTTTNVIPLIADYTNGAIVSQLVHATAGNLSSKNKEILNSADEFLKTLAKYVDASLLLQPVASQTQTATNRIKILMIERLAMLISQVYTQKPKAVHLHALPVLWSLLNQSQVAPSSAGGNGSMRSATCRLTSALYDEMGRSLVDMASSNSNVTKIARDRLTSIIDDF